MERYKLGLAAIGLGLVGLVGYKTVTDSAEYRTANGFRGPGYEITLLDENRIRVNAFRSWSYLINHDTPDGIMESLEKIHKQCGPVTIEQTTSHRSLGGLGLIMNAELIVKSQNSEKCLPPKIS